MKNVNRPRVVIAAAHSGSGKTTITSGIIAELAARGLKVHPYKVGPDYIDPGYLGLAAGGRADNLDTWLTDEPTMKKIFCEASEEADISIIEGVMGLYDGGKGGISSTARIAKALAAPVLLVIDVRSMGESAAAVALGFKNYDPEVNIAGVIINRYGSESHRQLVSDALSAVGIPVLGAVPRSGKAEVKERHLGLLPVDENSNREYIEELRKLIAPTIDFEALIKTAKEAPALEYEKASESAAPLSDRPVIAVARDAAFSFYYPESTAELQKAGAEIITFSPLKDDALPECDGLIFGGGFPEIFAAQLASNEKMKEAVRIASASGMPIYAECGGYMYLTRSITDFDGSSHQMVGIIPASCRMNDKLRTVGYVTAEALCDNLLAQKGEILRGHEFHFSTAEETPTAEAWRFTKNRTGESYTAGCAKGNLLGSYLHLHFAGFPKAASRFVEKCAEYKIKKAEGLR